MTKGCRMAEIIPYEPEPDNAGVGIVHIVIKFPHFFRLFPYIIEYEKNLLYIIVYSRVG